VDAGLLWAGGVATAFVAGLIALVGVLVCRWLFTIPILAPRQDGAYGNAHTTTLIMVAAGAALVATLLAHLLLVSTPRPMVFLAWIVGLVTVIFVVFPFRTGAPWPEKIATAVLYLVIGLAIASLLSGVGERATRQRPVTTAHSTAVQRDYQDLG
jgi:CBS domain containing-hemolysin-like protein